MADLTLGSGTTAVAVARAGQGRTFVGCEVDRVHCAVARRRVAEELAPKGAGRLLLPGVQV